MSLSFVLYGIERGFGHTLECVRTYTILALLFLESLQHVLHGTHPFVRKDGSVTRHLPIMVGKANGIAKRVDFVFTFVQFGLHLGHVILPTRSRSTVVERIGIRVDIDALELTENYTPKHLLQGFVLIGKLYIGPYLRTGVTQPHRMDVACIDKRIILAVLYPIVYGGVQRVRETVLEHPCHVGIGQEFLHFLYFVLDRFRTEQAVFLRRTLRHVLAHIITICNDVSFFRHRIGCCAYILHGKSHEQRNTCYHLLFNSHSLSSY